MLSRIWALVGLAVACCSLCLMVWLVAGNGNPPPLPVPATDRAPVSHGSWATVNLDDLLSTSMSIRQLESRLKRVTALVAEHGQLSDQMQQLLQHQRGLEQKLDSSHGLLTGNAQAGDAPRWVLPPLVPELTSASVLSSPPPVLALARPPGSLTPFATKPGIMVHTHGQGDAGGLKWHWEHEGPSYGLVRSLLEESIPSARLFVDAGANHGTYALYAATLGARSIAIEPLKKYVAGIVETARTGGLLSRVTILHRAVLDERRMIRMKDQVCML